MDRSELEQLIFEQIDIDNISEEFYAYEDAIKIAKEMASKIAGVVINKYIIISRVIEESEVSCQDIKITNEYH